MATLLIICIPMFFILAGALAALAFSAPAIEEPETAARVEVEAPAVQMQQAFTQIPWHTAEMGTLPTSELLAAVESQLRGEREAARAFAQDPSTETLWMN